MTVSRYKSLFSMVLAVSFPFIVLYTAWAVYRDYGTTMTMVYSAFMIVCLAILGNQVTILKMQADIGRGVGALARSVGSSRRAG